MLYDAIFTSKKYAYIHIYILKTHVSWFSKSSAADAGDLSSQTCLLWLGILHTSAVYSPPSASTKTFTLFRNLKKNCDMHIKIYSSEMFH